MRFETGYSEDKFFDEHYTHRVIKIPKSQIKLLNEKGVMSIDEMFKEEEE